MRRSKIALVVAMALAVAACASPAPRGNMVSGFDGADESADRAFDSKMRANGGEYPTYEWTGQAPYW